MESIIARALEYTLKYWLHSFARDQFKLVGRTAQLSNLDINGDALHASLGLPPALQVATARVGKLEIVLPSVSNVQIEPIVVSIDRLDIVLEENPDSESVNNSSSSQSSSSSGKGSGYGYADKIADGMTLEVGTVNLMLETRGGARSQGGATWTPPLASITIRNLLLYTTNENWQVVNLKDARDFSSNKRCIYVFKKLEWESLSIDLLPHPDMFTDARLSSTNDDKKRDDDGAKRAFFGGERFLEGISGHAYITVQRTEQNSPLGLEVQLRITEAVCPALSEPGLRALLRFMTGLYVCLNRGDVDPKHGTEAAGRSIVSIVVDHIFLCIKDAEFQLELLMQSLHFSRASVSDGEVTKNFSHVMLGGLFLRDTFSHPPCTLIQPSMESARNDYKHNPEFGDNFCPPIYPLEGQLWQFDMGTPLIRLRSLQVKPSPAPPAFASETIIDCLPLVINLQEETCLRISSFLADGIVVGPGVVLPDFSVNSFVFALKEFDITIPIDAKRKVEFAAEVGDNFMQTSFSGARLHIEDLYFSQSPSLKCKLLNLDKDPACFSLWQYQPIDASQRKWITQASYLSISLEASRYVTVYKGSPNQTEGLWRCVELYEPQFEAAMVTPDGSPLLIVPPPEGIVRIGVACQQYMSNASVDQLFFVLDLYSYFGRVSEKVKKVTKSTRRISGEPFGENLLKQVPSDTAVSLTVNNLNLTFLESFQVNMQGMPLVQFVGEDLLLKVSHRTLGGALALSTNVRWESVRVDCVDGKGVLPLDNRVETSFEQDLVTMNGHSLQMKPVFWVDNQGKHLIKAEPFLEISTVHVMPYDVNDVECHSLNVSATIAGIRLGGGMSYSEALLHRFGILGPDGGPGEGLTKGLKNLSSGPLAELFRAAPLLESDHAENGHIQEDSPSGGFMELGIPDDLDVVVELKNWVFALEGIDETKGWSPNNCNDVNREDRCWHTSFHSLKMKAKSKDKQYVERRKEASEVQKYPVELITVGIEGLQAVKPLFNNDVTHTQSIRDVGNGLNIEACLVVSDDEIAKDAKWSVDNIRFSVKQPIETVVTKEELEHLAKICRSEVDAMGRITAGILRLLKLEESLGQATLDQLSNLGSGGLDRVFTPEKLSRRSSQGSICFTPSTAVHESPKHSLDSIVASLEAEISDSQATCSVLMSEMSNPEAAKHLADVRQLHQKLERMQILLNRLQTLS